MSSPDGKDDQLILAEHLHRRVLTILKIKNIKICLKF